MAREPARDAAAKARDRSEVLRREQNRILERIARGEKVDEVLAEVARLLEEHLPGVRSSVLRVAPDRQRLRHVVAPSLPEGYADAIDGVALDPAAGPWGTAAHLGEPVTVEDLARDPRWPALRDLATRHGLRACRVIPLRGPERRLVGALTLYDDDPRPPTDEARDVASVAAHLAEIVLERHEKEAALEANEERYRSMADTAPAILWVTDQDDAGTFVSRAWYDYTGRSEAETMGDAWLGAIHPEDRALARDAFARASAAREPYEIDVRLRARDGAYRWVRNAGRPHLTEDGAWLGYVGSIVDVHDRVVRTAALRERERRLERTAEFRHSVLELVEEGLRTREPELFYQHILDHAVRVVSDAQAGSLLVADGDAFRFVAGHGYDLEALKTVRLSRVAAGFGRLAGVDPPPSIVRDPHLHPAIPDRAARILTSAGRSVEIRAVLVVPIVVDDEVRAFVSLDNFEDEDAFGDEAIETTRVYAGHAASLIQRFELEKELQRLAYRDDLTGLPNRVMLKERLAGLLDDRHRPLALMFVDLDDLKPINDSLGHGAGDDVLRAVAGRLERVVRGDALVARIGGDEFAVLLVGRGAARDAERLARRALAALVEPVRSGEHELHVSASIGIAFGPGDVERPDDLVRQADIAMYHAKQRGKNAFASFRPEMETAPLERLLLEEALREALAKDQFVLHYQPRVEVATGRIVCMEALVRWRHPERGLVPPGLFIPLAESTKLIHPLGRRVLEMAALQARRWRDEGFEDLRIAVNLSAKQLEREDLVDEIREIFDAAGVGLDALELEVLESVAVSDAADAGAKLEELRDLGARIALDDFGMGYSSLSYLRELPIDTLKIDRHFLEDLVGQREGARDPLAFVRAISELGRSFGLTVVAEGVERPAQWNRLRAIGCHEAQGYLLARPAAPRELASLLAAGIGEPE